MSQLEKIIQRFKTNSANIKFKDLDRILKNLGFELIETKGSHKKYKNTAFGIDIIIPVHNNECKEFYKKQVYKQIKKLI